jgi:hypothetical protein
MKLAGPKGLNYAFTAPSGKAYEIVDGVLSPPDIDKDDIPKNLYGLGMHDPELTAMQAAAEQAAKLA